MTYNVWHEIERQCLAESQLRHTNTFFVYFRLFKQTLQFLLQVYYVKKCPSSLRWTHDLQNMSLFPWPLDHFIRSELYNKARLSVGFAYNYLGYVSFLIFETGFTRIKFYLLLSQMILLRNITKAYPTKPLGELPTFSSSLIENYVVLYHTHNRTPTLNITWLISTITHSPSTQRSTYVT